MNSEDDVVEMNGLQNISAVNDSKSWVNPIGSPADRSTNFQQHHGEEENTHIRRKKSLYDYGMGSSVTSFGERDVRDPPGYFFR